MTGPPLANAGARHGGEVELAATRRLSIRLEAAWAARVSTLPRPIIRITVPDELASATTPIPSTTMAIRVSIRVRPCLERVTIPPLFQCSEGGFLGCGMPYPIPAMLIE
jgi:hypothetical protein